MKELSEKAIRDIRISDEIEFAEKSIERLDIMQQLSILIGENINRKKIEAFLIAIKNTTANKYQNKRLRAAYKQLLFEVNDEFPCDELAAIYLGELQDELIDAIAEHGSIWEEITLENSASAIRREGRSKKITVSNKRLNKLRKKYNLEKEDRIYGL